MEPGFQFQHPQFLPTPTHSPTPTHARVHALGEVLEGRRKWDPKEAERGSSLRQS